MGPIDQPPGLVDGIDGSIGVAEFVDEALEDSAVVEQQHARLVVHLVADHRWMVGVPGNDLANDPLGVELERRMGVVDLLPTTPRHRLPARRLTGDFWVLAGQPRRSRVGRRTEDDSDAALLGTVKHRLEPVEVEAPVLWFPGGPD